MTSQLKTYGINQIGIVVDDLEEAIIQHNKMYGSGPYFIVPAQTQQISYFGSDLAPVTMECAYGDYDGIQIEFIKAQSDGPSVYKDQMGFNHFSIWVDDLDAAAAMFADMGIEKAMEFTSGGGLHVIYFDARKQYGHFIECHSPQPFLVDMCKKAAAEWDGETDLIRHLG